MLQAPRGSSKSLSKACSRSEPVPFFNRLLARWLTSISGPDLNVILHEEGVSHAASFARTLRASDDWNDCSGLLRLRPTCPRGPLDQLVPGGPVGRLPARPGGSISGGQ